MKWYKFDPSKGSYQKRPPQRKWVVLQLYPKDAYVVDLGVQLKPGVPSLIASYPPGLAVGYMKNGGGDPQSPYFVIPGLGGTVMAWCDVLPDDFTPPQVEQSDTSNVQGEK